MTDLDALYRAIIDYPDDDTPRLVYADALEDVGESQRAAFIRAQVAAAAVARYDPIAVRYEYQERRELYDAAWEAALPPLPSGLRWDSPPFRRGFPAAVRAIDGATFLTHADELFTQYPIDSLAFTGVRAAEAGPLADCWRLSRLRRLVFPGGVSGPVARRVFNSSHLVRLTELHVGGAMTVASAAQNLIHSRAFRQLTSLSWRDDTRAGGAVVEELTHLADPPALRTLDVSGNRITAVRVARLAASPALTAVEELNLGDNHLGPDGVRALALAGLSGLRSLSLARTRPGIDGLVAITTSDALAGLRALSLAENHLGSAAGHEIGRSRFLGNLRVLNLRDNRLGNSGAAVLAGCSHLANLLVLDLSANQIEDDGAAALADSPHLGGLILLELGGNRISSSAVERLRDRFGDRVTLEESPVDSADEWADD